MSTVYRSIPPAPPRARCARRCRHVSASCARGRGNAHARRVRSAAGGARVHRPRRGSRAEVENGINDAEVARDVAELRAIGEALARLEAGHYGQCRDCDELIDERRLAAEAFAVRCTACQGRFEQVLRQRA